MFIRLKKTPRSASVSVQLVESFRENGKIKQRVVRHIGTASTQETITELKQLAATIKTESNHQQLRQSISEVTSHAGNFIGPLKEIPSHLLLHASELEEVQQYILGIHDVYGYIYEHLGFSNLFSRPAQRVFAAKVLREIVLARIAAPRSKRASVELLETQFGVRLKVDHVYQMMDKIDEAFCGKIQERALAAALKLSGEKLSVLFYDATTLYFESFTEDELKQNGYSKDMKFNQSQVLLALFVTMKGLPIGYELFPGSTFEGHTLIPALDKLKERYQLEEIVVVADRGLLSEANLNYLEEKKFKYIVGARVKNAANNLKEQILNIKNYRTMEGETKQRIASFELEENHQLIVNYSDERARKDRYDREKSIAKLRKKIAKSKDPKALLNNYGYKKYIQMDGNAKISVNEIKLQSEAQWDGLLGVVTNIKGAACEQVLAHYRGLWQIEECFRINKHDLRIRPIYHWTAQRIKAHIAIAFIAFVCVRYLEYRMAVQSQKLSAEVIRNSLLNVHATVIQDKKLEKTFFLPSKFNSHAKEIYRILRIKIPAKMMAINCSA